MIAEKARGRLHLRAGKFTSGHIRDAAWRPSRPTTGGKPLGRTLIFCYWGWPVRDGFDARWTDGG